MHKLEYTSQCVCLFPPSQRASKQKKRGVFLPLQIDLGSEKQVTGIITQGARDFGHIQYVAAYKLAYSNNGVDWTEYSDPGTSEGKVSVCRPPSPHYCRPGALR